MAQLAARMTVRIMNFWFKPHANDLTGYREAYIMRFVVRSHAGALYIFAPSLFSDKFIFTCFEHTGVRVN